MTQQPSAKSKRTPTRYEERCPMCGGKGIIASAGMPHGVCCLRCKGEGWVPACIMGPRS